MNIVLDTTNIKKIAKTLEQDSRVLFAYIYGSVLNEPNPRDVDIAIHSTSDAKPNILSSDLKILLHNVTGIPPDNFDIRIINHLLQYGDIFGLLYLKNVLTSGKLISDKSPEARVEFLESYGTKFRECEGLIHEVLT